MRKNPDIVICTPGRIVDLNLNSRSVFLEDVDTLIFDEADKLLEMGFKAEIENILKFTSNKNR